MALEDLVVPGGSPMVAMAAAEARAEMALAGGDPERARIEAAAAVDAAEVAGLPIEAARLGALGARAELAAGDGDAAQATFDAATAALTELGAVGLLGPIEAARTGAAA
jgi:hypothetical protein